MNEFEIIRRYFQRQSGDHTDIKLGIGDDAAIVSVPAGQELVLTMDTLVEGVHFPAAISPADIGWKALAVNLSDLAAMGAVPCWYTLGLTMPQADADWLQSFSVGLFDLAEQYDVALIGGDLTRGPLSVTIQAHGVLETGHGLRRGTARAGDVIYVSGTLGDAGYALQTAADSGYFQQRLHRPQPRMQLGQKLVALANSAIDISDGLLADLGHILKASNCGARLDRHRLPISAELAMAVDSDTAQELALGAGDDYELCFTVTVGRMAEVEQLAAELGLNLTAIGTVETDHGIRWTDGAAHTDHTGFRHFG